MAARVYRSVLVIGGYGGVGIRFGRLLVSELRQYKGTANDGLGISLVLAGRSREKATAAADLLKKNVLEADAVRIRGAVVDVADPQSVDEACRDCWLVVNLTTRPDSALPVAESCLRHKAHYMDFFVQEAPFQQLKALSPAAAAAHLRFVCQAGFHPGLPSTLVRYAALQISQRFDDRLGLCDVAMAMSVKGAQPQELVDLVTVIPKMKMAACVKGQWVERWNARTPTVAFPRGFGTAVCYPIDLAELHGLWPSGPAPASGAPSSRGPGPAPETGTAAEADRAAVQPLPDAAEVCSGSPAGDGGLYASDCTVGCYVAATNSVFMDYVLFPLMFVTQSIRQGWCAHTLARMYEWGDRKFIPADGVAMVVEASGSRDAAAHRLRLVIETDDAWALTAAPAVGHVLQLLQSHGDAGADARDRAVPEAIPPGVHLAGAIGDAQYLLAQEGALQRMGIQVALPDI